jgi:hypothetical protein
MNQIFKDLFGYIVLKIHKDLGGFFAFMKTGGIIWKLTGFVIHNSKQIFLGPDSWSMIQTESGFVIHNSIQIHGYTFPWYYLKKTQTT